MKISLRVLIAFALLLGAWSTLAARADETANVNVFAMLDARDIPKTLHGKDLTSAWQMVNRFYTLIKSPPLYTRGEMLTAGNETYLIAYARDVSVESKYAAARDESEAQSDGRLTFADTKISENDTLCLVLLNLRTVNSLAFAPFDPAKNLISQSDRAKMQVAKERAQSRSNMKQVVLGLLQYVQDYDEKLPPMRAAKRGEDFTKNQFPGNGVDASLYLSFTKDASVFYLLQPYLKSTQVCVHPVTKRPYVPNWRISRKSLASIDEPFKTIAFYEDAPDAEGMRNVAFVDGHVKAFPEAQWQQMRAEAKLPP